MILTSRVGLSPDVCVDVCIFGKRHLGRDRGCVSPAKYKVLYGGSIGRVYGRTIVSEMRQALERCCSWFMWVISSSSAYDPAGDDGNASPEVVLDAELCRLIIAAARRRPHSGIRYCLRKEKTHL